MAVVLETSAPWDVFQDGTPAKSTLCGWAKRMIHLSPPPFKSRESLGKAPALAGRGQEGDTGPPPTLAPPARL